MSERIKQMTVQQLIDAGFQVNLLKHNCGDNPELDAKQWINNAPFTDSYGGSVWASNCASVRNYNINPDITFYR